jgi:hypothetical protein
MQPARGSGQRGANQPAAEKMRGSFEAKSHVQVGTTPEHVSHKETEGCNNANKNKTKKYK